VTRRPGVPGGRRPGRRRSADDARRAHNPDDPRRAAPPAGLDELLADLRARRGWERRLEGARIHDRWAEIAGPQVAAHTEPVRLHGGVLVVRAESATWATEVRYLAAELAARANAVLGAGQVERVVLVTGRLEGPAKDHRSGA
jgi:predicted nucleic acid-binding Zn ribbon protein